MEKIFAYNKQKIGSRYIDIAESKGRKPQPAKVVEKDRPVPEDCTTIFVGNLPFEITEDEVGDRFRWCGEISSVRLAYNWRNKQFKGFGYVEFKDNISVTKSLEMNGKDVKGRNIIVDFESGQQKGSYKNNLSEEGNHLYNKEAKKEVGLKRAKKEKAKIYDKL